MGARVPDRDDKSALRARARAARAQAAKAEPNAGARAATRALALLPTVGVIAVYFSMGDEIDTRPLIAALRARGQAVALPVVVAKGQPLVFRVFREGDALMPGPLGTSQPGAEAPVVEPVALIVPLLAFDRRGGRLGYGGGFYDVTLPPLRANGARACGFAFAGQEVAAVPMGPTDVFLDAIVTERETIEGMR